MQLDRRRVGGPPLIRRPALIPDGVSISAVGYVVDTPVARYERVLRRGYDASWIIRLGDEPLEGWIRGEPWRGVVPPPVVTFTEYPGAEVVKTLECVELAETLDPAWRVPLTAAETLDFTVGSWIRYAVFLRYGPGPDYFRRRFHRTRTGGPQRSPLDVDDSLSGRFLVE